MARLGYSAINGIPFQTWNGYPSARLVPDDEGKVIIRPMTHGENEWYWNCEKVDRNEISREEAIQLAAGLSGWKLELGGRRNTDDKMPTAYGIYIIFKEKKSCYSRPFIATSDEYAKDFYMETLGPFKKENRLYAIASVDITDKENPLKLRNMEEIAFDEYWDWYDFEDAHFKKEQQKTNEWSS